MTYASVDDVTVRLGRAATPAQVDQIEAWLGDVESLILEEYPRLDERIQSGDLLLNTVIRVETNAVLRKLANPDGKVSEQVDDYNYRFGENARKGEVYLTEDEWASLAPGDLTGAFTITPAGAGPRLSRQSPWWPL